MTEPKVLAVPKAVFSTELRAISQQILDLGSN